SMMGDWLDFPGLSERRKRSVRARRCITGWSPRQRHGNKSVVAWGCHQLTQVSTKTVERQQIQKVLLSRLNGCFYALTGPETPRTRLPREAGEVARQALRPGCEELALRIRVMPETEARPRVKNRHGGAPRGERPALWDARRLARRLACR